MFLSRRGSNNSRVQWSLRPSPVTPVDLYMYTRIREPLYSQEHPPLYTIAVCTIVIDAARNYRRVAHLLLAQILNRHPPALQLVAGFKVTALNSQLRLVLQLFIPLSQGISVPWVFGAKRR